MFLRFLLLVFVLAVAEGRDMVRRNFHEGSTSSVDSRNFLAEDDAAQRQYGIPPNYYGEAVPSEHYSQLSKALAQLEDLTKNPALLDVLMKNQQDTIFKLGEILDHLSSMLVAPAMAQIKKQTEILSMFSQVLQALSQAVKGKPGYGTPQYQQTYNPPGSEQYYAPPPSNYPVPPPPSPSPVNPPMY